MSCPSVARSTMLSFVAVLLLLLGVLAGCGAGRQEEEGQAFITATPNPVPSGEGPRGSTTISWSTGEGGSWGQIYVSEDGAPETIFAEGKRGSQKAPWIVDGKEYKFRLYAGMERAKLLDKITVTRGDVDATTEGTTPKKTTGGVVNGVVPVQKGWSVSIQDFSFDPADTAVEPGFTLTWINEGNESHTVTAKDGTFDSGVLSPGDSFTVAFEERATLTYYCEMHPSMVGNVTVG